MNYKKIIILTLLVLLFTPTTAAQETDKAFTFEWGQLDGDTNYTILGSESGGWKSKLVFPLETKFIRFNYEKKLDQVSWGIQKVNFSLMKNLDDKNNGLMKDSDWVYSISDDKIIYSETKADLEALGGKLEVVGSKHYYNQSISYYFQSGYQYKNFDYNVHDGVQYNYTNDTQTELSGKVLTYDVKYHIPYLGVKIRNRQQKKLNWQIDLNLAPYVKVEDVDDHILRYKESTGETEGGAIIFNSSVHYNLQPNLIFSLSANYSKIDTDGHQDQYWYDGFNEGQKINNIEHTIDLESYEISTSINYLF